MLHHVPFLCLFMYVSLGHHQPTVTTSLGIISGYFKHSYGGRIFSAFEGIPYAKPPVGDLRFGEPQNIEPWLETWNATVIHECIQLNTQNFQVTGNEDCLYLNVYVAEDNGDASNASLDVIVHIHGGAFMYGSPVLAGPEYLMDRDIIYVNLNYRLGLLGFLSTEDDTISGNNGLKDQVMALKWVQNHIHNFGGNPKSVTLTGLSAGGAAVHLHYLSPLSRGLFHRGISQSGTALVPWALQEASLEKFKKVSASVDCDMESIRKATECLKQRSAKQLTEKTKKFFAYTEFPLAPFAPTIEKPSKNAFLADHPYKLLKKGLINDVPWIASTTSEEGIFPVIKFFKDLENIEKHWNELMPHLLDYNYTATEENKADIAKKIKEYYFGKEKLSLSNIKIFKLLIKLFGDRYFKLGFEKAARMHAKVSKSPVYSYVYGYRGEQSLNDVFGPDKHYGVAHGEDGFLLYTVSIFGLTFTKEKLSESDELIKEFLLDAVTSYARKGEPQTRGIKWEPVTNSDDFGYLFIHNTPDEIRMTIQKEVAPTEFWNSLPILENEKAVPIKDEL